MPPSVRLQQALKFHQKGELTEAETLYEEILQHQPEQVDALHFLGVIALQKKNHEKAVELFTKAIEIYPHHAVFYSNQGLAHYGLKQFEAALASFDKVIALKPDYAEAYLNRGMVLYDQGAFEDALASFEKALDLKPDFAKAYFYKGVLLHDLNQLDVALASFDQAIALKPDYAEAHANRDLVLKDLVPPPPSNDLTAAQINAKFQQALILHQQGQIAQAKVFYEQILKVLPKHVDARHLLGVIALQSKEYQKAVDLIDQAIAIYPDNATFYSNRAIALKELKQFEHALANFDKAIALNADYAEAYSNRGNTLYGLRMFDEALKSFDRAIALKPDFPEAHSNRGNTLQELNLFDAALECYDKAIDLKADYPEAFSNRGLTLQQLNRFDEALESFEQAIALKADFPDAWLNKALALLQRGNFKSGWKLYEWRWKYEKFTSPHRNFMQPLWLGKESLEGKTILLHAEQGLGDTIQFSRYVHSVAELGAHVILELPQPLYGLLKNLDGVTHAVTQGDPLPEFELHTPLLSLPFAFNTELDSIPSARQYIKTDPIKLEHWKSRLGVKKAPRVGLVWSTSVKPDKNRNIALAELIQQLPGGFEYVSLQKEIEDHDRETLQISAEIVHFDDELEDFSDTAALSELMDVVISIDTSVAHLAGALGKPVWILLPFTPNWRWLLDRADSPWYDSARLYRQQHFGDWQSLLEKVARNLQSEYGK
ncbi:MAG: tetratricopeptide repeat protein [Chlorobiaceae bacterium]|nr:tetratricopeptide repeat protein [Chlorobiaceae bacterium]